MLELKEISKSFLQRGTVLDGLNLTISAGESIAVMGPSGSGKTTLMNLIGLLDKPDSGDIRFNGDSITEYSEAESAIYRNRNIGFVFQEHFLLPHLTIFENILLPLVASDDLPEIREEKVRHASELMKRIGIADLSEKLPSRVSGGEAQRAALVRALVNKPSLLLADEPTGSLDSKNAEIMGNLLSELNSDTGITIILSTHSEGLARKMSHSFGLENGKLIPK